LKATANPASGGEHPEGAVPLPRPFKQKIKDGIVAFSLANLCFISAWFSQLYDADFGYYNNLPITPPTLLALLANVTWLALVFWLVMCARRRYQSRIFHFMVHLGFFLLWLIPFEFIYNAWFSPTLRLTQLLRQPMWLPATVTVCALVIWQHRWIARVAAVGLAILSPLAFLTAARIVLLCLGIMHLRQANFEPMLPPPTPVREGQPRVIWMIFDEMDYRLAFEQRPASVALPAFDRLRNESLFATNAYPPADGTKISMPSLISGQRISQVGLTNASDLAVVLEETGKYTYWSKLPSVFFSARQLGFNTALVGWALPYDRELGQGLNYCAWHPFPGFQPARAATFGAALLRQIACMVPPLHIHHDYVQLYLNSMAESLSVVTNASYGLTLLHLFPPHEPGLYLADNDQFPYRPMSKVEAYFNNLVLADRSLGKLRRAMETSGEWDKTWVIISADHSWRTARAYDGRRDYRVPFLVKSAGTNGVMTFSPQFNTVVTHDFILAILRGEITREPEAAAWLEAHQSKQMPVTFKSKLGDR
jgi:hypothetical protein